MVLPHCELLTSDLVGSPNQHCIQVCIVVPEITCKLHGWDAFSEGQIAKVQANTLLKVNAQIPIHEGIKHVVRHLIAHLRVHVTTTTHHYLP